MPVQVMPKTAEDSCRMKSPISSSFFKRVRFCMLMGGTYPGERKKRGILSFLMMIYVGFSWIVWTGSLATFIATIYIKMLQSRETIRMITYFLTLLASCYPSVINSLLLPKTLRELEELFSRYEDKHDFTPCFRTLTKCIKVVIVIIPFNTIFGYLVPVMVSMQNGHLNFNKFPSCEFPEPWRTVSQSNSIAAFALTYIMLQTNFLVFNVVAYILLKEFGRVSKRFQKILSVDRDKQEQEFKSCAEQYDELADLLSKASDFTQHFSLAILFLSLPLACVYMYTVLVGEVTDSDITEMATGAFYTCIFIGVWLLTEANVSLKAREPLQYVWKMKTDGFTREGMHNVQMLISRLMGDSPAYSIYGLLTINMPTVLSVVATMAAYAIVVAQFRTPSSPSCQPLYNSSQSIVA